MLYIYYSNRDVTPQDILLAAADVQCEIDGLMSILNCLIKSSLQAYDKKLLSSYCHDSSYS